MALLLKRNFEEAIEWGQKAVRFPQPKWAHAFLLSAFGHAGRSDEAQNTLDEIQRVRPEFTTPYLRKHLISIMSEKSVEYIVDGVIKAGLPEE